MKVLILHQHFNTPNTGGAIRSYYLAKALVDAGHDVIVITGSNKPAVIDADIDGIQVYYLPVPYDNKFGFYKRSVSFVKFSREAVRFATKFSDSDVCYAISVPLTVGVAAMRIKKRFKIPFVFEVGDLWPDAPIEMGFITNPFLKKILLGLERQIYADASVVVALSDPIAEAVRSKCPGKEVVVIPNMADTEFFTPEEKDLASVKKFQVEGKFVISYVGTLGFANGLTSVLEVAEACEREKLPVHFIVCGEGAMRQDLEKKLAKSTLKVISLLPFTNRDGVRQILNVTDAAFISFLPFQILTTGSPNKYFDALAAGKLIINNFSGWMRREIEKENLGFSFNWNDTEEFIRKLKVFLSDQPKFQAVGENAHRLAQREYSRKLLSQRFIDLFNRVQLRGSSTGK